MSDRLACLGGAPVITAPFPNYVPIGPEEVEAVRAVVESGVLSKFIGGWNEDFFGGAQVRQLERDWERYFDVPHAVTVNSATSGLIAAVGALDIEPGDEVIVSPWTMCASATAIVMWNAIPVFADIEPETFNLDPKAVERCITPRTKAIVAPDIFGHTADLDGIMAVARKHGLKVIEDAAQAPAARYHDKYVGTIADLGVFSLNYHKHIHTGEGGVVVTRDPVLCERVQLLRNHAEAVVGAKGVTNLSNMVGFNFRMGEIEAAIGISQLCKLEGLAASKSRAGALLTEGLGSLEGLRPAIVKSGCTHVFYIYPLVTDPQAVGVGRAELLAALRAEGVPGLGAGYVNVHRLPMYQRRIAYGSRGFPWTGGLYQGAVSYEKGVCPVAERLHDETFLGLQLCLHNYTDSEVEAVVQAFHKVWSQRAQLRARRTEVLAATR